MTTARLDSLVTRVLRSVSVEQDSNDLFGLYPEGTWVVATMPDGSTLLDRTRGAVLIINDRGFVSTESHRKPISVDNVRPAYAVWVRVTRGRKVGRWVECVWKSRYEAEAEIARHQQLYPDIRSVEVSIYKPC